MKKMNALNNNPFSSNRKGVTFNNSQKPATPSNNALLALQRQPTRSSLKQVPRLNAGISTNQSAVALHEEVLANHTEIRRKQKRNENAAKLRSLTNAMIRGEITHEQMKQMRNTNKGGSRKRKRTLKRK
jgi:hypothetical protein